MSKKYRSDALAAIHETMEALHDVGAIDKQTMRRFDDACLTPIRLPSSNRSTIRIRCTKLLGTFRPSQARTKFPTPLGRKSQASIFCTNTWSTRTAIGYSGTRQ